jgi:hypothetical protein
MVGEKKEEDIVGRLEALRKKVPPPSAVKPPQEPKTPASPEDEKRKKTARIVGILVIIIVLAGVVFIGSKFFLTPTETPPPPQTTAPPGSDAEQAAKMAELAAARADKIDEIEGAYAGLPSEYTSDKAQISQSVKTVSSKEDVNRIQYETSATNAWRSYRKDEVDKKAVISGGAIAIIGENLIKGADDIKSQIDILSLSDLKSMVINEMRFEFIPIRLPRNQLTGGFAEIGDLINIHYIWTETFNATVIEHTDYLAKDGRIVAIMKPASTISLSETEQQRQTGGGAEGIGNVTSITVGGYGLTISDGPYGASVGVKSLEKSSSYTVNLAEVQKAAAASKISPEEFMENMEKYGARLTEIERETNIGDFNAEYLMLVEVSGVEASKLAPVILDNTKKTKILVTISKAPSWAS